MKTENLLILGAGAYLFYKMVQNDINSIFHPAETGGGGNVNVDLSNLFGAITFPNIEMPTIDFSSILNPTIAGTSGASWDNPATQQPDILHPGSPDPYTGAPVELLTGMPKNAQWANNRGEGYAYGWTNKADPANVKGLVMISDRPISRYAADSPFAYQPSPQPFPLPQLKHNLYTTGSTGISTSGLPKLFSTAPVGSVAAIKASTIGNNANTLMSESKTKFAQDEERSVRLGLVKLGRPLGSAGIIAPRYASNSILSYSDGNIAITDAGGHIIHDSSAIINESARAADIARYN